MPPLRSSSFAGQAELHMPELPEVETIKLGLQKYLVGHIIESVDVRLKKIVQGDIEHVVGAQVTGVERFGKGLVIELDNGYSIAVHIKLTGQLVYRDKRVSEVSRVSGISGGEGKIKVIKGTYSTLPNKWTHVIFKLNKNAVLYYNDFRQFGWIRIDQKSKIKEQSFFKDLGPELPMDPKDQRETLTLEQFQAILSKSRTAIKPLLMDQKKIGGIGNIYANDGLFLAKINPKRPANSLTPAETKTLYDSLLVVLRRGLKYGGASELSYINALGEEGSYQKHFLVYAQQGKPCQVCGTPIEKYMLAGRGTYVCPSCQK